MRFRDRVVVITGAAKGIGRAAALAFSAEGGRVAIVDNDREGGARVQREIEQPGGQGLFLPTDLARAPEVEAALQAIVDRWGRLDVLVNNAGIYYQADAVDTPVEVWESVMSVNLTAAYLGIKYAVPVMARNGGGVIVNVSSEAGLVGIKGQVAYNVSKGGMIALTRSCAVDFAHLGIRVNCICPGTTDTPLVQEAVSRAPDPDAARRALEQVRPLNRLGRPEEIAAAILTLASDEVAYATGAIFSVDGGYTAQ